MGMVQSHPRRMAQNDWILMKTALATLALFSWWLASSIQTDLVNNADIIITQQLQWGGPTYQHYQLIMVGFYSVAILATSGIGIAVLVKQWNR
jgi:hypothetical protein